jgi:hypothetical protein
MQRNDPFEKNRLGARDILDGLARHGLRQEADEVARVSGFERNADLALGFESADARAVPGAGVDDDERPPRRIDLHARWRNDFHQAVVHRPDRANNKAFMAQAKLVRGWTWL